MAPKEAFVEEVDAKKDFGKKLTADVQWNLQEATLNVVPTMGGKMLMCLNEGGFQYLLAGVRANVGIKAGRYMFETKIVESLDSTEPKGQTKAPTPKQLVRLGFSLSGSSQFQDTAESIFFESDGSYTENKKKNKMVGQKFGRGQTVALLLNVDDSSNHKNTLSLFIDGKRATPPQVLPEGLTGKPLFPTITYRNVTLRVNFGPTPMTDLPFTCRMIQDAAVPDVEVAKMRSAIAKYEAVFPVGLPQQGVFDWADQFLEKNPSYTEISDRAIIDWAAKSGLSMSGKRKGCNDKPLFNYGLPLMDDMSVERVIKSMAPMLKRDLLITQLQNNLCKDVRSDMAGRLRGFKKVAVVLVGEPNKEYKERVQKHMLAEKTVKVEAERKVKKAGAERKRLLEEKIKKAEEAKKAKVKAAKEEEKKKKAAAGDVGEEGNESEPEEAKEEKEDPMEEDDTIVLTDEEKAIFHRKMDLPDLTEEIIGRSFGKFSMPTKDDFDEIKFEWQKENASKRIMHEYVLNLKMTLKVHDLPLSEWFKEQWGTWQKLVQDWKATQKTWKKESEKRAAELQKKALADRMTKAAGKKVDEEDEPNEFDSEAVDALDCKDILDLGNGEPLFAKYSYEDWCILSLAYELHLCVHSFRKTVDDDDRPSFAEKDLAFYYQRHYNKSFSLKNYSAENFDALKIYLKDCIKLDNKGQLETLLEDDATHEYFVRIIEDQRRERDRRIDAGDETARINFPVVKADPPRIPEKRPIGQSATAEGNKRVRL